jgi:DnaK suppressor protein
MVFSNITAFSEGYTELPSGLASMPYMNNEQLIFFETRLQTLKNATLRNIKTAQDSLSERPEVKDEADLAQHEETLRLALRSVERETKLLPKIDAAIKRIRDGEYGYCLESGEAIGVDRLSIRPTAEYSAEVKNQMEEKEKHYGKRR